MATWTLTGNIADFGDAAGEASGTITAGGLVGGKWTALPAHIADGKVHVERVKVKLDATGALVRTDGSAIILQATNGFSYRLRLHFPSANVWRQWDFNLTANLDVKDIATVSPVYDDNA